MKYVNPILRGDYSDPDIIRVGEDFYMISSSFTYVPGIPVLHSRDLVHWELIGYATRRLPFSRYDRPAHRCGTWAPSLRYHQGKFYVYVCLPDEGLLAFTAEDPAGEWECHWVMNVSGWIDPCPLFEADGTAWLVHGFAASRCGINNILYAHQLSPDGLRVLDKGVLVYSGADHGDITVEGPKWYRRDGFYWILCPAGGVKPGYQLALRSENRFGPYERKIVLAQGSTPVNGPHQGGWVDDGHGRDWFVHFQDAGVYGRIVHLQPVDWSSGWPVMGNRGEPVPEGDTGLPAFTASLPTSDSFQDGPGLQWQWQANPNPAWFTPLHPGLRLHAAPSRSLYESGQFLSQLMQGFDFDMDVSLRPHFQTGDLAGLGMMGYPCHAFYLEKNTLRLCREDIQEFGRGIPEEVTETLLADSSCPEAPLLMRLRVRQGEMTFFWAGPEEKGWHQVGPACPLSPGGWTAARPGVFCQNRTGRQGGWVDLDWVRFTFF
ncbi:MAG: family 43 glycosylhydrolase [Clostridia bacterium]|nr:family 43 glycosylhydrolase [Clostridia bacterium]